MSAIDGVRLQELPVSDGSSANDPSGSSRRVAAKRRLMFRHPTITWAFGPTGRGKTCTMIALVSNKANWEDKERYDRKDLYKDDTLDDDRQLDLLNDGTDDFAQFEVDWDRLVGQQQSDDKLGGKADFRGFSEIIVLAPTIQTVYNQLDKMMIEDKKRMKHFNLHTHHQKFAQMLENKQNNDPWLIFCDDAQLIDNTDFRTILKNLLTIYSHHRNISVIFITQQPAENSAKTVLKTVRSQCHIIAEFNEAPCNLDHIFLGVAANDYRNALRKKNLRTRVMFWNMFDGTDLDNRLHLSIGPQSLPLQISPYVFHKESIIAGNGSGTNRKRSKPTDDSSHS